MPSSFIGIGVVLVVLLLVAVVLAALIWLRLRSGDASDAHGNIGAQFDALADDLALLRDESGRTAERLERSVRGEVAETARIGRAEMGATITAALGQFQHTVASQLNSVASLQNQKVDGFARDLANLTQSNAAQLEAVRLSLAEQARHARDEQSAGLRHVGETLNRQLDSLSQGQDLRFAEVRATLERKLKDIEVNNAAKLDEMRRTVDEKLHATLEQRLGASFKMVSDRLEQVHRGLGEMQTLATGVGDLKKVLTNIKTRGTWGEVQLGVLLEQVLTVEQYAKNVATVPGSSERVEFAIRLPGNGRTATDGVNGVNGSGGRGGGEDDKPATSLLPGQAVHAQSSYADHGAPVWLPIDAKFPREDYERLVEAQERADPVGVEEAGKALDARVRLEARRIAEKYISPPHTTDFGLLFLPTEGLYAEVLRRPGLSDSLQRDYRITIAGPTTLTALLNSLQMGFRTLAIERRSSEVWQVLGAVKTEFSKFGDVLSKTRAQLETVTRSIDMAERRSRVMHRTLRDVEALPGETAARTLGGAVEVPPTPESGEADVPGIARRPEETAALAAYTSTDAVPSRPE
jgi:DNA recombination protein RmuC